MKCKILALLLVICVLTIGCSKRESGGEVPITDKAESSSSENSQPTITEEPSASNELKLAYDASDSLNPYKLTTALNRTLVPLFYDSLTRPDKTYAPENQLATNVKVTDTMCTVSFRKEALFTDGATLSAADIIYSVETAKSSETGWKTMLSNVSTCKVNETGDVEFQLYKPDADFAALLSFPIIKEGTSDMEYPTGIGKFYVAGTWTNGLSLTRSPLYYQNGGKIETVRLLNAPDAEAIDFALKTGEIDMSYSDLSAAEFSGISGSSGTVSLNNLVFIGINGRNQLLAETKFRQAISKAINRDELMATAYVGHARQTLYPFHPNFYKLSDMELSTPRALTESEALLDELGLTEKNADGWRLQNKKPISLSLLVNSENSYRNAAATLIASQLRQVGIKVEIVTESYATYLDNLKSNKYDLFIGETRLMDNMDISGLLSGGAIAYAAPASKDLSDKYDQYCALGDAKSFCEEFANELPFIPILFREGVVTLDREFGAEIICTEQDLFYNILEW